jgi:hypothetical protein
MTDLLDKQVGKSEMMSVCKRVNISMEARMYIMTAQGWKRLVPPCQNQVWTLSTWDGREKRYVPDAKEGSLHCVEVVGEARCEPKLYDGPIPSEECLKNVARRERAHRKWLDRRAALFDANESADLLEGHARSPRPASDVLEQAA